MDLASSSQAPAGDGVSVACAIQETATDAFLQCVKRVVEVEKEWPAASGRDAAEIEAERRRLAYELFDGVEHVDLVGHSTPKHCYLRLGDWVLDPDGAERLASYLPKSVKVVRLIGCGTASTEEGRAAAAAFTRHTLEVYGTLHKVYTTHFDHRGVKPGIEGPTLWQLTPDGRGPGPARGWAVSPFAWLRRAAWWAFAVLYWIFIRLFPAREAPRSRISGLLRPEVTPMPGLLADPLLTFEIDADAGPWTLEILFDFEHARFYPSAGAAAERDLVYEIRGDGRAAKTPLEIYLERAPRGVTLLHRHAEAGDRCGRVAPRVPVIGGDRPGARS